jgi:hypothetical protein
VAQYMNHPIRCLDNPTHIPTEASNPCQHGAKEMLFDFWMMDHAGHCLQQLEYLTGRCYDDLHGFTAPSSL